MSRRAVLAFAANTYGVETLREPRPEPDKPTGPEVPVSVDVAIAVVLLVQQVAARLADVSRPFVDLLLRPPLLPRNLWPQTRLDELAAHGRAARHQAAIDAVPVLDALVPRVLAAVLDRIDLTRLVLERVDIERLVAAVDVDRVVERANLERVVDRVPVQRVLDRVDVDAVVSRVDTQALVDRIDIDAIAARLNLDAIIARLDLAALANDVIDEIDLPDLLRESSGAMGSETVRGLRMQGIRADEGVSRIVDRLLLRRRPASAEGGADVP